MSKFSIDLFTEIHEERMNSTPFISSVMPRMADENVLTLKEVHVINELIAERLRYENFGTTLYDWRDVWNLRFDIMSFLLAEAGEL